MINLNIKLCEQYQTLRLNMEQEEEGIKDKTI